MVLDKRGSKDIRIGAAVTAEGIAGIEDVLSAVEGGNDGGFQELKGVPRLKWRKGGSSPPKSKSKSRSNSRSSSSSSSDTGSSSSSSSGKPKTKAQKLQEAANRANRKKKARLSVSV